MSGLVPTRIISWQQVVLDADPDWYPRYQRPWIYEWSNGRRHYQQLPYPNTILFGGLEDDNGVVILSNPSANWPPFAVINGWYNNNGAIGIDGGVTYGYGPPIFWNIGLNDAVLQSFIDPLGLPDSDPGVYNQLYNNNGELAISRNTGLALDGGVVILNYPGANWPTTPYTAVNGWWSNGGLVSIVYPASSVDTFEGPVFYAGMSDVELLQSINPFGLPGYDPGQMAGQLWNDGGVLAVSIGPVASLFAVGMLAAIGVRTVTDTPVLPGVGSFSPMGSIQTQVGTATFQGISAFSGHLDRLTFSGVGQFVGVSGQRVVAGATPLPGVGALTPVGASLLVAKAAFAGVGGGIEVGRASSAVLSAAGSLTAVASTQIFDGQTVINGQTMLTPVSSQNMAASATFGGTGGLT